MSASVAVAGAGQRQEGLAPTAYDLALTGGVLALLSAAFVILRIEHPGFYRTAPILLLGATAANAVLPPRHRPLFFLAASLATFVGVLGSAIAAWVVAITLGVAILCLLPVSFRVRAVLLAAASAGLVFLRAGVEKPVLPGAAWPVVGSLLMFRSVLLLYELRFSREKPDLVGALGYLFLLPNALFLLFPVVDPAAMRRARSRPLALSVHRGTLRLTRGLLYLALYRIAYRMLLPEEQVRTAGALLVYLLANYLLILHVMGLFDLAIGMLQTLGLDLPEINRRCFEPDGPADFWRRNNLYWRELVQKIVLYPVYFRLRRGGETRALVVGTIGTFVASWALHAYQRFWLVGRWVVSAPDILFWGLFGAVVLLEIVRQRGRQTGAPSGPPSGAPEPAWRHPVKVAGSLLMVALLWSLWTSSSVSAWIRLLRAALVPGGAFTSILGILGVLLLAIVVSRIPLEAESPRGPLFRTPRRALASAAAIVVLLLAGTSERAWRLLGRPRPTALTAVKSRSLSQRDLRILERGYYEGLLAVDVWSGELASPIARAGVPEAFVTSPASRPTGDVRRYELRPGVDLVSRGARLRTNAWGLRDRAYARVPVPGTSRVALMGASHVMGLGVADDEVFESLVEERLNRGPLAPVEILNFGFVGYGPVEQLWLLEHRVLGFRPRAVVLVGSSRDLERVSEVLRRSGPEAADPSLLAELGAGPGATPAAPIETYRRLLARFADVCRQKGVTPTWLYLDVPGTNVTPASHAELVEAARAAGFGVLDLVDVYAGSRQADIVVSPLDRHPNGRGHALIADRLVAAFTADPALIGADARR